MGADSVRFEARWSLSVGIITIVVTVLVVTVSFVLLGTYATSPDKLIRALAGLGAVLVVWIVVGISLFAPGHYVVRSDGIVVRRLGLPLVIPYEQIHDLRRISSDEIGSAWRVLGSGGFLGWFGWFYNRPLGRFLAYATNRRDLVLITKTDGTKIVISPHPPNAFLEAVRGHREKPA